MLFCAHGVLNVACQFLLHGLFLILQWDFHRDCRCDYWDYGLKLRQVGGPASNSPHSICVATLLPVIRDLVEAIGLCLWL